MVEKDGVFSLDYERPKSVGALHSFFGNFGIYLRAYTYITRLGSDGIRRASSTAILNANYLAKRIARRFPIPYGERCMHEFVATGEPLKKHGVRTLDVAKRLLDFGFYAPTVYFPLTVPEALMVEPTETESKETLDRFAEALLQIAREAEEIAGGAHLGADENAGAPPRRDERESPPGGDGADGVMRARHWGRAQRSSPLMHVARDS